MATRSDTLSDYNAIMRRLKKAEKAVAYANAELREAQEAYRALMCR